MRRLIREPLLHFFLLGAALFALYGWLNRDGFNAPNEIVVSRGEVDALRSQFERLWQRAPTQRELQGLVDNWIREEIFYREGLAMGLDRDDQVVRRRIGQKMEFIVEGLTPSAPTTEELQNWLDAHADRYRIEPRYSLQQIYFDPTRRARNLESDIASARNALTGGKSALGDATMLPSKLNTTPTVEVARVFGAEFADALETLPLASWQGPIRSGFGLHLVRLSARSDGRSATLDEVRVAVERDLMHARLGDASAALYKKLRQNYVVRIDSDSVPVLSSVAGES